MTAPTGVGPGGRREGAGRPFGSTSHKARRLIIEAERNGDMMPLDYLLATMRDTTASHRERLQAAAIAAPFCHPKLTAQVTAYINPDELSDEELLASISHLEKLVGTSEADPPDHPSPGAVIREDWQPPPEPMLRRPGAPTPEPAPADGRRLLHYDPAQRKMVSRVS